jgi:predicted transcriptional regulator
MKKKHISINIENPEKGYSRFVKAWHGAENGKVKKQEVHLGFYDFDTLCSVLTPRRLDLLRCLHREGPLSVRALAQHLKRDYKNVHTDTQVLLEIDLIERTEKGLLNVPWDVIDTHVNLAA